MHEVPLQLLCPTQAALQRFQSHFSTQVKTIQEKERGGWVDGGSSPAREGSAEGAGLELSLSEGTFSQVLLQTFVFPLVQCVLCVCSPLALLLPCCWSAPTGGKGALPPSSCASSVCAGLCWLVARVRCCWQKKGGCQSAQEENCCFREGLSSLVEWFAVSEQISNSCILGHGGHSWKRQWHILNPLGKGLGESNGQPFIPHNPNRCVQQSGKFPEAVKPQRVLGCSSTGNKELEICQFL